MQRPFPRRTAWDRTVQKFLASGLLGIPVALVCALRILFNNTVIPHIRKSFEVTLRIILHVATDYRREPGEWERLIWVVLVLGLLPIVLFGAAFFLPLNSVNAGVESNRVFLYATMTFYQILAILPWIETCNFVLPEKQLPARTRALALLFLVSATKCCDAAAAEGLLGKSIFPIPFSIMLSVLPAAGLVIPILSLMAPERDCIKFHGMQHVLFSYGASFLVATGWAIAIQHSAAHPSLQSGLVLLYAPLRFACKSLITDPVTTARSPERWIQLNLVIDILFARLQVSTFPFVDGYHTLVLLFTSEVISLAWRYYCGIDRLELLRGTVWTSARSKDPKHGAHFFGCSLRDNITVCFGVPVPFVAQMNLIPPQQSTHLVSSLVSTPCFRHWFRVFERKLQGNLEKEAKSSSMVSGFHKGPTCEFEINSRQLALADTISLRLSNCCSIVGLLRVVGSSDEGRSVWRIHSTVEAFQHQLAASESIGTMKGDWRQRPLYHIVDSTGANLISIIVRVNQLLSITLVRSLPSSDHLNKSFRISDERWKESQVFGWTYVVMMIFIHGLLGRRFFRGLRRAEGINLTLDQVIDYLCRDNCWFFFLWFVSTGSFVCVSMVSHFGADFSLKFRWVACPDQVIEWPGCPPLY